MNMNDKYITNIKTNSYIVTSMQVIRVKSYVRLLENIKKGVDQHVRL